MKRVWTRGRWAAPVVALAAGCAATEDGHVRFPDPGPPAIARCAAEPLPAPAPKVVPVSLDAVFRLAEGQNAQLAAARERVTQAFAEQDLAAARSLPDVSTGVGYYRHEGGIQDQDGTLVRSSTGALLAGVDLAARLDLRAAVFAKLDAARKTLQQKGELSRLTRETLLDAASTYVDLLAAQGALAATRQYLDDLRSLLDRARRLAEVERGARVEVARIEAELSGQELAARGFETQTKAAAAKLAYLLGLDPVCTELEPVDGRLVAFRLTDATQPVCELVAEALTNGPGVKELENILALIQEGMAKAEGPSRFLPVLQAQAFEGGFGAGPNANMTFDNRFDLGVQARWSISELFSAGAQRRVANSILAQTQLTYTDLRGKLTLGVQEARESILNGEEQIRFAADAVRQAKSAADLSDTRQRESIQGSSFSEVVLAKRSVALAQLGQVGALRDYDKAQLRLFVLLSLGHGPCAGRPPVVASQPAAAAGPPPAAALPPPKVAAAPSAFNANTYP